jgi:hypothetical protein
MQPSEFLDELLNALHRRPSGGGDVRCGSGISVADDGETLPKSLKRNEPEWFPLSRH